MDLQIDHVTICGRDLAQMRNSFAELGLATEYGGAHANGLTHMALAGFEDGSYLELIAPLNLSDLSVFNRATGMMTGWLPLMLGDAGPGAWAIRANRIHQVAERLRRKGIEVRGPERGGRRKPDGTKLEWETALLGTEPAGSLLPFMIEDYNDRDSRVGPFTASREEGYRGIAAVIVAVEDLSGAVALFQSAFGGDAPSQMEDPRFEARIAHLFGTPVILASPLHPSSPVRTRLQQFGEGPLGFLFSKIRTETSEQTSHWFGRRIQWLPGNAQMGLLGVVEADSTSNLFAAQL